jgi:hypothetical protein
MNDWGEDKSSVGPKAIISDFQSLIRIQNKNIRIYLTDQVLFLIILQTANQDTYEPFTQILHNRLPKPYYFHSFVHQQLF